MQAEQATLEANNHELVDAYQKRTKSHQQTQQLYQSLKAQVMASQVANAAGDEADHALRAVRGDRFIDRIPGTRTGTVNLKRLSSIQQTGDRKAHDRNISRSSGSSGQKQGGIGIGPSYASQLQARGLNSRAHTGRELKAFSGV